MYVVKNETTVDQVEFFGAGFSRFLLQNKLADSLMTKHFDMGKNSSFELLI